ncbi:MAG: FAD-binding oxidoreductase [Deltaproteobacteria bacterium]|nr:FAD-binding oxidoreductase [Deltaproteobacteria bacterium]
MSKRQVSVIGRGIIGLTVAQALLERGWQVTVIGPQIVLGAASRAAVGTSTLKGNVVAQNPFFGLKISGHQGLKPWLERLERISNHRISRNFGGAFEPFPSVSSYRQVRERVFHRQFTGCKNVAVVDGQALKQLFPHQSKLNSQAIGAFHYYQDLWFDPSDTLDALESYLRLSGVNFLEGLVHSVVPAIDNGLLICLFNGQRIQSEEAVLATGVFANEILERSGFQGMRQDLVEGETLTGSLEVDDFMTLKLGKINLVIDGTRFLYGSSSRSQSALSFCASNEQSIEILRQEVQNLITPSVMGSVWGIRGRFKSRTPGIGSVEFPAPMPRRLWVALGFYKNGLQLAHLFANNLASLMDFSTSVSTGFPQPMSALRVNFD